MFEIVVIERKGMRGYYLRVLYLFTLSLHLNTRKGQHVSLGLTLWRLEATVGMGMWDRSAG